MSAFKTCHVTQVSGDAKQQQEQISWASPSYLGTEDTVPVLSEAFSLIELRKHLLNPSNTAPAVGDTETWFYA